MTLTRAQRAILARPVRGSGGFQSLLRRLRKQQYVSPADLAQIRRYAQGRGGFQGRMRQLLEVTTVNKAAKRKGKLVPLTVWVELPA